VDIDDDQDLDILAVAYSAHQIAWYRNDGGDPIQWTKQIVETNFQNACIAQAADLDGDGDLDIAASAQTSDEVAWWRNDGGNPIVWTKFIINGNFDRVWPLYVCDLDGDNDQDVIAASGWQGINEVKWWENTGTGITEKRITEDASLKLCPTIIATSVMMAARPGKKIYDITGREIKQPHFTPGIYFVETEDNTIQKVVKIQ
jgi:hypothetical protein